MNWYKNYSNENLVHEFEGVLYTEQWMPAHGFYSVSNFGRIKTDRGNCFMKQYLNEKGYLTISLSCDGVRKKYKVHRLVAILFIENPENKPEVNHDNFDKTDNFFKNLLWNTGKENTNHAQRGGKRPMGRKEVVLVGERPVMYKKILDVSNGTVYDSTLHLSEVINVSPKEIRRKLSGEVENDTTFIWLEGEYSFVYKKRNEKLLTRFNELRKRIFGDTLCSILFTCFHCLYWWCR